LESRLEGCCSRRLAVALIQPGTTGESMLETCRAKSREVMQRANLICWPESSIGDFPLAQASFRPSAERGDLLTDASPMPELPRPLLCGGGSFTSGAESEGPLFNTAFLIDAQQNIVGRYHKRALAPWGEYVAGQQWIPGLRELFGIHTEFRPGDSAAPLRLPGRVSLGVLICYEDLLEGHARDAVRAGANVLVNLNNLSAFGRSPAQRQHQQLAQFRAVENRRYLLRCGTVGSTAVISATGRVIAQAPPHEAAALVKAIPLMETRTVYTQWGNVFAVVCLVGTAILIVSAAWGRRIRD
jgi:apolipoprotein N-acyltransferase